MPKEQRKHIRGVLLLFWAGFPKEVNLTELGWEMGVEMSIEDRQPKEIMQACKIVVGFRKHA